MNKNQQDDGMKYLTGAASVSMTIEINDSGELIISNFACNGSCAASGWNNAYSDMSYSTTSFSLSKNT